MVPELHPTREERMAARGQLRDNMDRDVCVQGLWHFLWTPETQPCMKCRKPTTWIDIDFEGPLHPGACSQTMWDDYAWAEAVAQARELAALIGEGGMTIAEAVERIRWPRSPDQI